MAPASCRKGGRVPLNEPETPPVLGIRREELATAGDGEGKAEIQSQRFVSWRFSFSVPRPSTRS